MNRKMLYASASCLAGLFLAIPSAAQNNNRFTFNIGGGFTQPVRYASDRLDRGFNINAGAGVNFAPSVGIIGEFGYNHLGLTRAALSAAGVPGGDARIYSMTANPIVRLNPHGRFDAYLMVCSSRLAFLRARSSVHSPKTKAA